MMSMRDVNCWIAGETGPRLNRATKPGLGKKGPVSFIFSNITGTQQGPVSLSSKPNTARFLHRSWNVLVPKICSFFQFFAIR